MIPGTPPRDYSLAAESPAGHLRQVLQILDMPAFPWTQDDIKALRKRVAAALALLERTP